jgi:hypothetical protein
MCRRIDSRIFYCLGIIAAVAKVNNAELSCACNRMTIDSQCSKAGKNCQTSLARYHRRAILLPAKHKYTRQHTNTEILRLPANHVQFPQSRASYENTIYEIASEQSSKDDRRACISAMEVGIGS